MLAKLFQVNKDLMEHSQTVEWTVIGGQQVAGVVSSLFTVTPTTNCLLCIELS